MKKCKIISTKLIGREKTYNLTMKSKQHNYAVYDANDNNHFVISKNSCCYAYLSYITAYLKANYTDEFFCVYLNVENIRKNQDKISELFKDMIKFDIELSDKDINSCMSDYKIISKKDLSKSIMKTVISPSLMCKGIGQSAAQEIEDKRPYDNLRDLASKTSSLVDQEVVGSLADNGFFDKQFSEINKGKKRNEKILKENFKKNVQEKFANIRKDLKAASKKGVESTDLFE